MQSGNTSVGNSNALPRSDDSNRILEVRLICRVQLCHDLSGLVKWCVAIIINLYKLGMV